MSLQKNPEIPSDVCVVLHFPVLPLELVRECPHCETCCLAGCGPARAGEGRAAHSRPRLQLPPSIQPSLEAGLYCPCSTPPEVYCCSGIQSMIQWGLGFRVHAVLRPTAGWACLTNSRRHPRQRAHTANLVVGSEPLAGAALLGSSPHLANYTMPASSLLRGSAQLGQCPAGALAPRGGLKLQPSTRQLAPGFSLLARDAAPAARQQGLRGRRPASQPARAAVADTAKLDKLDACPRGAHWQVGVRGAGCGCARAACGALARPQRGKSRPAQPWGGGSGPACTSMGLWRPAARLLS